MNMQRQIDEMKLWLDDLAAAYEVTDPDEATKAILIAIVKYNSAWRSMPQGRWSGAGETPRRSPTRPSPMTEPPEAWKNLAPNRPIFRRGGPG